ncbi:tau 95 subunit of transcription factor TFIIIC [Kickxella alabastrina]|uniref:Tau 95 subunit of transcription factor TFIIIC n=1 Tax=Kickxella alabastrina TaxID=61397 RepID=A0ACC1IGI5_9FUNG|nr:tau 95 subunit of transcription factor TFIIIC [Kickxella alabastrina]
MKPQYAERLSVPQRTVLSVEYPGFVKDTEKAIQSIGGREKLARDVAEDVGAQIELRYRYNDPTSHPISGEIVATENLLIKVTRHIKKVKGRPLDGTEKSIQTSAQIVGVIEKTARFRKLADFQYVMPRNDPLTTLTRVLQGMDLEEAKALGRSDTFEGNLDVSSAYIPAPFLDRAGWPAQFPLKAASEAQQPLQEDEAKGTDNNNKKAAVARYKLAFHGITVKFNAPNVPTEPSPEALEDQAFIPQRTLDKARRIIEENPVVGRNVMEILLPISERGGIKVSIIMSTMAYIMETGPWRSCWIRFGYDPRTDKESYKYQILDQRRVHTAISGGRPRTGRPRGAPQTQGEPGSRNAVQAQKYIFDEETAREGVSGMFQFRHIELPMIKQLIEYPAGRRKRPCEKSGWLQPSVVNTIRVKIRILRRFFEEGLAEYPKELQSVDYAELDKQIEMDRQAEDAVLATELMLREREESSLRGQATQDTRDRVNARVDEFMKELGTQNHPGAADAMADMYDSDMAEFDIYGEESDGMDSDTGGFGV